MITISNAKSVVEKFGHDIYRVKAEISKNLCGQFIINKALKPTDIEYNMGNNTFTIACVEGVRRMVGRTTCVQKEDGNGNPINEWVTILFLDTTYLRND